MERDLSLPLLPSAGPAHDYGLIGKKRKEGCQGLGRVPFSFAKGAGEGSSTALTASFVYLCSYNRKIINSSFFPLDFIQRIVIEHHWAHRGAHFSELDACA